MNVTTKRALSNKWLLELLHADTFRLPETLVTDRKGYFLFGILDDCTRLT